MTSLGTAILAGVFTLLGGCLAYFSSQKVHERQAKEARKARRVAQLERLNKVLEHVHANVLSILVAARATVNLPKRQEVASVDDASLAELEFLTRVYLPRAKLYFAEIKSLQASISDRLIEVYTSTPEQLADKLILTQLNKLDSNLSDSVEHLREALVEAAREIEGG